MIQNAEELFHILDQLGLNFEAIILKFLQIEGNIVVYNLWIVFVSRDSPVHRTIMDLLWLPGAKDPWES